MTINETAIPNIKFACPHSTGYKQAICNSALIVVEQANQMFQEMIDGDSSRLEAVATATHALEQGLDIQLDDSAAVFEELIDKAFPIMVINYAVSREDILEDVSRAIDYYSSIWITGWVATEFDRER